MIGTIRKHSAWLWYVIAGLTIISFVWFMGSGPARNNRAGSNNTGGYGTIYGHEITPEAYENARREFFMYYWLQHGQFPSQREGVTEADIRRESYIRLLISEKAKTLGVSVSDDAVTTAAAEILRSLGRNNQSMPMDQFVQRVLTPENLTVVDFQNYLRSDLAIQQTIMALGLPGALIAPQEAAQLYDREYQEVSAQAVFFSYSNELSKVTVTPEAVQDFYTKNQAEYREPDRVKVSYVAFELTNFLAAALEKIGKTNLDSQVETIIRQQGIDAVPGAKTAEEAKAKIREFFLRKGEIEAASKQANDFATTLYAMTPAKAENLATVAKQKGLAVQTLAPFAKGFPPEGLTDSFVTAAFSLSADQPFSEMVSGTDALYLIALDQQIPSAVPTLEQIRSRVSADFRAVTAQNLARNAGMIFQSNVNAQVTAGKTFAQAAVAAGATPTLLKPFSLSSGEIPEAGARAEIGALKQAAFTTPIGKVSTFFPASGGGFVLSPQNLEPVDPAKKSAALPQFLAQVRRARQNQAFNQWLQTEVRELHDTPVFAEMTSGRAAK